MKDIDSLVSKNKEPEIKKKDEIKTHQDDTIHEFNQSEKTMSKKTIGIIAGIIIFGVLSGYFLSSLYRTSSNGELFDQSTSGKAKKVVGSKDTKTFKDSAEGILEEGGIDGEGTHRLIRPGGDSQTVYLTSSVLDLNEFVGKKVKVWGETFAAKKAAWLMDVGRVELLE